MTTNKQMRLTKRRNKWLAARHQAKELTGPALNHNAAVAARYQKRLTNLVAQMTAQVNREVEKLFKSDAAQVHFGQDASVGSQSRILTNQLKTKFEALFASRATPLAQDMVSDADAASKTSLHASLKELSGGLSLKAGIMDEPLTNIYKASVTENVSLIKSIASEYLNDVQQAVMRSITTGSGLQDLVPALEKYEGQTHRRAKNIALDQTRKVYNNINKGRMSALGVEKYKWIHSGGGAHPRELHMEYDGRVFRFDDPPVIDERTGEKGIPGQAINCRCTMSPVFEFSKDDE